MSIAKFRVGRSAASGAHSEYITRVSAATRISFHNLAFLAAGDLSQARTDAIAYIYARQDIELARSVGSATSRRSGKDQSAADDIVPEQSVRGNNSKSNDKKPVGGKSKACQASKNIRTHYRLLLSWDRKVNSEEAVAEKLTSIWRKSCLKPEPSSPSMTIRITRTRTSGLMPGRLMEKKFTCLQRSSALLTRDGLCNMTKHTAPLTPPNISKKSLKPNNGNARRCRRGRPQENSQRLKKRSSRAKRRSQPMTT